MSMPAHFFLPWVKIDPTLRHGGIAGELEGQFVGPDIGDNTATKNLDMLSIFQAVNEVGASISMHHEADREGYPAKSIVEESLQAVNYVIEHIMDRTHSTASKFFGWNHAVPPTQLYKIRPLRYPLRSAYAQEFVHFAIGALVECAENNRNAAHSGLDPQAADKLIAPFYDWKARQMKFYFDIEVEGELSREELNTILGGKFRPGPTVSPPDETAETPNEDALSDALKGANVLQWYPDQKWWAVFGNLNDKRYQPERIWQPEGARATTEDVAPETLVNAGAGITEQP